MTEIVPLTRARIRSCSSGRPGLAPATEALRQIYVVFTGPEETLRAIRVAGQLASAIGAGVTVIHFRAIGFGAPLDHPAGLSPVETETFRARLAAEDGGACARVCLCRDARQAIRSVLDRRSLIVIGCRRRWWPTSSDRWRRTLEAQGYLVVLVGETGASRVTRGHCLARSTEQTAWA
jgi:hypothetical protein